MSRKFKELILGEEFYFQWHITEKCNLRCKHCYHENYLSTNELSLNELLEVLDLIDNAASKWGKRASLSITGGEPLIRLIELKEIIKNLEKKQSIYYYDLLTNGTLLDESTVSFLSDSQKLRRIQLSLEGSTPEKNDEIRGYGSFEKILNGIDLLKKRNIPVSIMITLTKANYQDIPGIVELGKKLGVEYLSFERFIPEGSGLGLKDQLLSREDIQYAFETIANIAETEKEVRILTYRPLFSLCGKDAILGAMCSVGTNALTIMHDGTVYPCRRLAIPIGHVLKDGLYKIWYDTNLLWEIRDCRNLKGKCNNCKFIPSCRGCRAMAYYVNGDYLAEDPQCWK